MHSKLYTFSQTRDPNGALRDDVVWLGSANMTHATGAKSFNNTLTIYGDTALYDHLMSTSASCSRSVQAMSTPGKSSRRAVVRGQRGGRPPRVS